MFYVWSNTDGLPDLLAWAEVKFETTSAFKPHVMRTLVGWKYNRLTTHTYVSDLIGLILV